MPFNPAVLLAYLEATYEPRTWNIAPAFLARPDLFGGGALVGTRRDKLALPDGRVFDLLVGASVGGIRWWVADVTDQAPEDDDGAYPLEPGPLSAVDVTPFVPPALGTEFEGLVGRALEDIGGVDAVAAAAAGNLGESLENAGAVESAWSSEIGPAASEIDGQLSSMSVLDISGPIASTDGLRDAAGVERNDLPTETEYTAPYLPVSDPGGPPEPGPKPEPPEQPQV